MKSLFRFCIIVSVCTWLFPLVSNSQDPCNLICNDHVHASLPSNGCTKIFSPGDFLENPDPNCNSYSLKLNYPFGTAILTGADVNRSHLGYTLVYNVYAGNNSCWGYLTVEDKAPPQPFCKNGIISCFQLARLNEFAKTFVDNCTQEGKSKIERLDWEEFGCQSPIGFGQVVRTIRSFDIWGNTGTCTDTLIIRKDSFPLIKCPDMISLGCRVLCKKVGNTGSSNNLANFDVLTFSSNKTSPDYPSPEKLLALQERDTFKSGIKKCISPLLKVVPYIKDSVFKLENNVCVLVDTCVRMYPSAGTLCNLLMNYNDLIFPVCGNGFKIRREWRFTSWCTGRDTVCVQYVNIEDNQAPIITSTFKIPFIFKGLGIDLEVPGYRINIASNAHDCNASFCMDSLKIDDCSKVTQNYDLTYIDPNILGSAIVKHGKPKDCFTLPAAPNNYFFSEVIPPFISLPEALKDVTMPRHCYPFIVTAQDACFNHANSPIKLVDQSADTTLFQFNSGIAGLILVCITDETPPNPVCDEVTRTTIDPDQCWSRIYAENLDNGSRDNCCDVLHFAIAHMDSITYYRDKYTKQLEDSCGKAAYWKDKAMYDEIIDAWINCYVFKDYLDLTNCKENQIVLRIYEACGVPRYDSHVYSCSPHSWFCYNTYPAFMLWHNYQLDIKPTGKCESNFPWLCLDNHRALIKDLIIKPSKNYWLPAYPGATRLILSKLLPIRPLFCWPEFYYSSPASSSNPSGAPGNTCSKRLYSDCMIQVFVDDKTPPVSEQPVDKFWYCDNVSSEEKDIYEYATCVDYEWSPDNARDKVCYDKNNVPYNAIECAVENDLDQSDTVDATLKAFGWYGCNIYGGSHPDEHGAIIPCNSQENSWAPIYCHTWLCLDKNDAAGKIDPKTAFDVPVLRSGNPGSDTAGPGKFWIWDNCWINDSSLTSKDEFYFDKCDNGWIKRTWSAKDICGNTVTVDQKITTKHRSDFEVLLPADKITVCDLKEDVSPEVVGKPVVMDDECELVGVNYDDQIFDIVPDACYKIVRTWRIVDWCKFDPGQHQRDKDIIVDDRLVADSLKRPCVYRHLKDNGDGFITYVQIILIRDTIAPVLTCIDDTVCIFTENCSLPSVDIPFSASDNCTTPQYMSYRWELNEDPSAADLLAKTYNKSSIDKRSSSNVKGLTIVQKQGRSLVTVIAEDNCGNEDTCTFILTVRDCKNPTPYCYHGVATVIMPSTGTIKVWAKDLDAGSYDNCTSRANLKFSFGPIIADSCKIFECKDIPNGIGFTVEIDIYVWDEAGNFDYCKTFISIQDGAADTCEDAHSITGSISGVIQTMDSEPVEHVMIEAHTSHHLPSFKTTLNGQYAFLNLPLNSQYVIKPQRNDQPSNGVSTIDLLMIQKHILGVQPFENGYQLIAADVNNDKEITALDLIELRKLILFLYDALPANKSWRFIPKSIEINRQNPWSFTEFIDIKGLRADELNRDFVGIKIGDLNNSVAAHSLAGLESRSIDQLLTLSVPDQVLLAGQEGQLTFTSPDFKGIEAFQFSLKHEGLDILEVKSAALEIDQRNFGVINSYLTTSWDHALGRTIPDANILFSIKVKANKKVRLSESLAINSMYTKAESYNGKEIGGVNLIFDNSGSTSRYKFILYQNVPNPFQSSTLISFDLPRKESVELRLTDLTGKTLISRKINGVQGYNQYRLDKQELGNAGVYYYSIETTTAHTTKRMILVN